MPLTEQEKIGYERELTELMPWQNIKTIDELAAHWQLRDINNFSWNGRTPLQLACILGKLDLVKDLITLGADKEKAMLKTKSTPLHLAVKYDHNEVAKFLILNKANINPKDENGSTPLHIAMFSGNVEISQFLINQGAKLYEKNFISNFSPIGSAIYAGQTACVACVIPLLVECNPEGFKLESLLHLAILYEQIDIALLLLDSSIADKMLAHKDCFGRTPLDVAMTVGADEIIGKITGLSKTEFSKLPGYNQKPTLIGQDILVPKLEAYLTLLSRDKSFLSMEGMCNGLAFTAGYFATQSKSKEFLEIRKIIAEWDLNKTPLTDKKAINKLTEKYQNLEDLFEYFLNHLAWFQQKDTELEFVQAARRKMFKVVSNQTIEEPMAIAGRFTKEQLTKALQEISAFPNSMTIISGFEHSVSIYVQPNGKFLYYDPTLELDAEPFDTAEQLADFIQKIKYQYINLYVNKRYYTDDTDYMDIYMATYRFDIPVQNMTKPSSDEEFMLQLLKDTNAFVINGNYDIELIEKSYISVCEALCPQSFRAMIDYLSFDPKYVDQGLKIAFRSRSIPCILAFLERGYVVSDETLEKAQYAFKHHPLNIPVFVNKVVA